MAQGGAGAGACAAVRRAVFAAGAAGEVLTREEISRELWPDGTFVDFEHGVNSAVNRLREALGGSGGESAVLRRLWRGGDTDFWRRWSGWGWLGRPVLRGLRRRCYPTW